MKINRNNYEIWFLDYFEGRLSAAQKAELMAFLDLHYDLKEEFDHFENVSLPPSQKIVFDAKKSLKKPVIIEVGELNGKNYEEFFIGMLEGDLTEEQVVMVNVFLAKNPQLQKEFDIFNKTKISTDLSIQFPGKESLKKIAVPDSEITTENCTEYFIANIEGELSVEQEKLLTVFLADNPELKKEFDLFFKTKISPDSSIVFDRKESLKKSVIIAVGDVNEKNYAEYFIVAMEGDLTLSQMSDLKEFLKKNPKLHNEYKLFGDTKLIQDTAIIFNRKQQLKQPVKTATIFTLKYTARIFTLKNIYYPVSIAASLILLIAIYFLLQKDTFHTIDTADRNNINLNRNIQNNSQKNSSQDNIENRQYYANNLIQGSQNNSTNIKNEYKDFQYASVLSSGQIPENSGDNLSELTKITVYEDFYAMMLKKKNQAEELKEDDSKSISLKDFALFKLKKSIAPENKKDKISPTDSKITLWDVADAGVNKFNNLTGANARLDHKKDNSGFTFALGNNIEISRKRNSGEKK